MNTKTFKENYELDPKAKGVRARAKNLPAELPPAMTADGEIYDPAKKYFYFDQGARAVRETLALRRDGEYLGSFGLRVVLISNLRSNRDAALSDGQEFFKDEVKDLQNLISEFELQKSAGGRSLKAFLMAKE